MDDLGRLLEARLEAIVDRVIERKLGALSARTQEERPLSRKAAAKALGWSVRTLDKRRKAGMPCRHIPGSAPVFLLSDCLEWVRQQELR